MHQRGVADARGVETGCNRSRMTYANENRAGEMGKRETEGVASRQRTDAETTPRGVPELA